MSLASLCTGDGTTAFWFILARRTKNDQANEIQPNPVTCIFTSLLYYSSVFWRLAPNTILGNVAREMASWRVMASENKFDIWRTALCRLCLYGILVFFPYRAK